MGKLKGKDGKAREAKWGISLASLSLSLSLRVGVRVPYQVTITFTCSSGEKKRDFILVGTLGDPEERNLKRADDRQRLVSSCCVSRQPITERYMYPKYPSIRTTPYPTSCILQCRVGR